MMVMPKAAKRSACDRCRAKRVRCPRAADSTEPCARCVRIAAPCVTGSPGHPGRPRKPLVDSTAGPTMTPADISSPGYWTSTPRDSDHLELHTSAADEPMSLDTPSSWLGPDTSLNLMDDLGAAGLSKPAAAHPLKGSLSLGNSDPWSAHAGGGSIFGFPLPDENSVPDSIPTLQLLSTMSDPQDPLGGTDSLGMLCADQDSYDMLDLEFLDSSERQSNLRPFQQRPSATTSLIKFREKMEQRISAMASFLSEPRNIVEDCPEDFMSMATENPIATAIMCTKELIEIIQNLMPSTRSATISPPSTQLDSPTAPSRSIQPEFLSTETTLLILSSYLQLMRFHESLFHDSYRCMCQISPETIKSIKVKSVLHIGGIPSLQDVPVNMYAQGVFEVIQSHIRALERCMELPAAYCVSSSEAVPAPASASRGIFADSERARLLHTVMAQEDVRSQRGNKSYAESIRENIENLVALFGG